MLKKVKQTPGQVVFPDANDQLIGDPQLFWNNASKFLLVGTSTANAVANKLQVTSNDAAGGGDAHQIIITSLASTTNMLELGYNTTLNHGTIQSINQGTGPTNLDIQPYGGAGIGRTIVGSSAAGANSRLEVNGIAQTDLVGASPYTNGPDNGWDFYDQGDAQIAGILKAGTASIVIDGSVVGANNIISGWTNNLTLASMTNAKDMVFQTNNGAENTVLTAKSAGNLDIPTTVGPMGLGTISQNGVRFIHSFGNQNFFAGTNAGNYTMLPAAVGNVGIGSSASGALASLTTGNNNVAVGGNALTALQTGSSNVAVGTAALFVNVAGFQNTGVGQGALNQTTGSLNTGIGQSALASNTSGQNNVGLGQNAGASNTTENNNTFIGTSSNGAAGITNGTAVGWNSSVTQSNSLILGNIAAPTRVGIGMTAPTTILDVIGTVNLNADAAATALTQIGSSNGIHRWLNINGTPEAVSTDASASTNWDVNLTGDMYISGLLRAQNTVVASLTPGQVVFPDANKQLAGNTNLFWDYTNNRLGVGFAFSLATLPEVTLDVVGATNINNGDVEHAANFATQINTGTSTGAVTIGNTANSGAVSINSSVSTATTAPHNTLSATTTTNTITATTQNNITGATGNSLTATTGNNIIAASAAQNQLTGQTGNTITATTGNNVITASAAQNQLTGQTGNTITATTSNNVITASAAQNQLTGQTGNTITATTGNNVLTASAAQNQLTGQTGNAITATTGNNTINASAGQNQITGQTGNSMTATTGNNTMSASTGQNQITGQTGNSMTANTGNNTLTASAAQNQLTGQTGNLITATTGNNTMNAVAAQNQLTGQTGNTITATTGNNAFNASAAQNQLTGQTGNTITATTGNNVLNAVAGQNQLTGQTGNTMTATTGNNTIAASAALNQITGQTGNTITATTGNNVLNASAAQNQLTGQTGNSMTATTGNNVLGTNGSGQNNLNANGNGGQNNLSANSATGQNNITASVAGGSNNIVGATNINDAQNFNTKINTGGSTGTVTIGNAASTGVTIASTGNTITAGGLNVSAGLTKLSYGTVSAGAAIIIPTTASIVEIQDDAAAAANAVTMPAVVAADNGRLLYIYNGDAQATAGTVINSGATATFIVAAGAWQRVGP